MLPYTTSTAAVPLLAQEVHFLFSMEDSRDAFNIPHDLRIYKEVFKCDRATRENAFWKAYDVPKVRSTHREICSIRDERWWAAGELLHSRK